MFEAGPPSKMIKELIKTRKWIMDVLWPRTCLGCGREGLYICKDCELFLSEVNMIEVQPQSVISVWEHEGIIEKAIFKIKYDGCYDILNELLEKAFGRIELNLPANTYITYVPMYKKKERMRGFNQAELIAKKVGERISKPMAKFLEKTKNNQSQDNLTVQERLQNVKDSFKYCNSCLEKPKNILLVDDVYATGATMQECIRILKEAGVEKVWGFTLSRKMNM